MRDVFLNAKCILGLDIDNRCKVYEDTSNNIFVEIGDATDLNFIKTIKIIMNCSSSILNTNIIVPKTKHKISQKHTQQNNSLIIRNGTIKKKYINQKPKR